LNQAVMSACSCSPHQRCSASSGGILPIGSRSRRLLNQSPHATIAALDIPFVSIARLAAPVDWQAIDDTPVDLVVLVLSPENGPASSLDLIARFARRLRSADLRARLRSSTTSESFHAALGEVF